MTYADKHTRRISGGCAAVLGVFCGTCFHSGYKDAKQNSENKHLTTGKMYDSMSAHSLFCERYEFPIGKFCPFAG